MNALASSARSLEIGAQHTELRRMSAWLLASAQELGVPGNVAADLEICANEAAANIISYGYMGQTTSAQKHIIGLTLATMEGYASLTIIDDAKPFNPLDELERPDPTSLEKAPIGGLGIRLIRTLCSDCSYSRVNGLNHFEMRISLNPAPAQVALPRGSDRRKTALLPALGAPEHRAHDDRRRHGKLLRASFFHGMPWHAVEDTVQACPVRRIPQGNVLLEAEQFNDEVFVLIEGRLAVRLPDADTGDSIFIEPGGSIGELSIIDNKPASARVVAETDCKVAVISSRVFWDELMPVSGFARNVMRQLSERMRSSNDIIVERLKERVALDQLQKELGIAREIQSSMLPPRGEVPVDSDRAEVFGLMDPARDIGGDFYDVFMTDSRHLMLMVGDVSGKGIPAALFMSRAMAILRAEALRGRRSPSTLLERANTLLCANNEAGMFVTLLVALLDLETGELQYANAGHLPLCRRRTDGTALWLPLPSGMLAGMIENEKYVMETLRLEAGDSVLLYTDGATEAMNPRDEFFGDERLLDALITAPDGAGNLVNHVRARIAGFVQEAPVADDITLLGLHWRG